MIGMSSMANDWKNIYKDKVVFVSGHTGFKGSWLSVWLTELGAKVIGYSNGYPGNPCLFEAINLQDKMTSVIADVRDNERLNAAFERYQPAFVFHLAAQPLVRLSYQEPRLTYETNVMGTVNILEAVRVTRSVRACVVVTSDKCYDNKEWIYPYREIDPLGGHDPYSSSKACAELVVEAYRKSFFHSDERSEEFSCAENSAAAHPVILSSVRAGNVIGGGDWGEGRLLPDCVRFLSAGKPIVIRHCAL